MNNNTEFIEKYIDGELEKNEILNFEKLLSGDQDLKRDYDLSVEINNSIIEDDVMALRDTLDYMYNDEQKVKRTPSVFANRRFYYAAASAALLIATGGMVQRLSSPDLGNNEVFEKYYTPYEITVTHRSGNTEVDRLLLNAFEKYENKDYEQALVLFEEVLESRNNDMAVNLYSGISYLEEEKYQKAKSSFSNVISDDDNLFIEQAKWYLGMCYLKTENANKAEDIFNEIVNEESHYKDVAIKVLKDLNY
ncbi:MAG: tetratricopeptide repeat protein [Bacteroidales bacterium]|nr:tetratricopeptide repeat protein [Bacteroidales bacterium]